MKHTTLTHNPHQAEKLYFTLYLIYIALSLLLLNSCATTRPGTPEQWREFNTCIDAHPSDAVCDSCYFVIFHTY